MANAVGPLDFFVYVIESPSASDLYHGRSEAQLLQQATALNGVPCVARTVISLDAFKAAVLIGLPETMKQYPSSFPILHLSSHGAASGVQLSDGSFLNWDQLKELLSPINKAVSGSLVLCMSACAGISACQMAMQPEGAELTFLAVVGHVDKPMWSDTAVAYAAFYHHIAKGAHIATAVEAMKKAAGDDGFVLIYAENAQRSYLEVINGKSPIAAQLELEQAAESEPISELAKSLETSTPGAPSER